MQVAILAGQYQANNFNVQKHQNTPERIQICNVDSCHDPIEPQQEIDGETPKKTTQPLVKGDEDIIEASGVTVPTKEALINDVEGSGLPVTPKIENEEPKSTPHTAEVADEHPLTGVDAPSSVTSSSSSSSSLSTAGPQLVSSSTPIPVPMTPEKSPFFLRLTQNSLEFIPDHVFEVDNQTTKTVSEEPKKEETEKINDAPEVTTPRAGSHGDGSKNGCGAEHEDLKICESYFAEYLGKVNDWSEKHNMTVTSHMWKVSLFEFVNRFGFFQKLKLQFELIRIFGSNFLLK